MSFAQPFADYEILERLGAGAMGTVFKAQHKKLRRTVALKVLRPSLARNERFVDRLRREARIVASLNHPNIVTGYDLGEEGGYHFFVMEYVEGQSLRQLLAEWGMFPEDQVLNVALQVARALDHAYQKGVIHRDIKPGNILIDERGRVKLTDMGLAKGPTDLTLTRDGATVGTPQYISPEQARNPQEVDIRSDLYSLGATLFHMATGQSPFRGDTMAEVITKVLHERAPSATEINPRLSDGLSLVIRKLLAKDISLRYQTPAELLADLERVERDETPEVDRGRLDAADAGGRSPRRALLIGAAAVAMLSLLSGYLLLNGGGDASGQRRVIELMEERLEKLRPSAQLDFLRRYAREHDSPALLDHIRDLRETVLEGIQREVDAVAGAWLGPRRDELDSWLNDHETWPMAEEFARQLLVPELLERVDLRPGDLPPQIRTTALDRLMEHVREEVRDRDRNLLAKFEDHLRKDLRDAWQSRLVEPDFAAAAAEIDGLLTAFFDGERHPEPSLLTEQTRTRAEELYAETRLEALSAIGDAEQRLAAQMRDKVDSRLSELERFLDGRTEDPTRVALEADRLENELHGGYPPSASFRPDADPWPDLEDRFEAFETRLRLAESTWQEARLERRLLIAYRALERGSPETALEFLADLEFPQHQVLDRDLQLHRQWLRAAAAVLDPLLETLASADTAVTCKLRSEPMTSLMLRVTPGSRDFELAAKPPGGEFERVTLGDLVLRDLLEQAERIRPGLLAGLPDEVRQRGRQLLAWLGEDPSAEPAAMSAFAAEEVLPRLALARDERRRGGGKNPRDSLERVLEAHLRAAAGGELRELEEALRYHELHHADASLGAEEERQLTESERWLKAERRRRAWLADLERQSPPGVRASVVLQREGLEAQIAYPAAALSSLAAEQSWELAGERLAFVGAGVTLESLPEQRLDVASGLPATADELSCTVDVVFPRQRSAPGLWFFEFQGVLLALALRGDDTVMTVLARTSALGNPELLKRELRRALSESLRGNAPVVVPGAIHSVRLESTRSSDDSQIRFRALLDGREIAQWSHAEHEAQAQAILRLYPTQPIEVQRVRFRGRGL